jgi:hypothetical protein
MASEYQLLELDAHETFADAQPSQEQLAEYLQPRIEVTNVIDPVTISLAALAVSVASLMLQGWQAWQPDIPRCPRCGRPAIRKTDTNNYICIKDHEW